MFLPKVDAPRRTLVKLRSKVLKIAQIYNSPKEIRDLEQDISNFLDKEISTVMQEAEKEASISKNRVMISNFSLAVCQYLDARKDIK